MRTKISFPGIQPAIIVSSLFLAGIFIVNHITARAFWVDEADVANTVGLPFSHLWHRAIIDGVPLSYAYVLKFWSLILGDSELSLRGFSALFALLLIVLIYRTADKFFENKKIGIIAAFVAATNYFLVWFATQNKVYTFAAFLGLLSYFFFFKLAYESEKKDHFLYFIFTAVCAYTHPWLILVFISQVMNLLLFQKDLKEPKKLFFDQMIVLILIAPSLLATFYQGELGVSAWIGTVPLWTIFESIKYLCFGSGALYLCLFIIAAIYIFLLKIGPKKIFNEKEFTILKMLLVYLLFPLIAALLISQFGPAYSAGRYEMIVLPAFLLLSSIWFSKIDNNYLLILMVILLAAFCFKEVQADRNVVSSYQANDKTIARGLIDAVKDGDTIIATDLSYPTFSYYLRRLNSEKRKKFTLVIFPQELSDHPCWENLKKMSANKYLYGKEAESLAGKLFRDRRNKFNTIWVLYNVSNPFNADLREKLKKHFNSEEIISLPMLKEPSWVDLIFKFN